ncbi:UNVERIFIED_CONTAM: hypothetical protein K2H54_058765 [Gekko kuhli]
MGTEGPCTPVILLKGGCTGGGSGGRSSRCRSLTTTQRGRQASSARQAPGNEVVMAASVDTGEGQVAAPQAAMAAEEGGSCRRCHEMGRWLQEFEKRVDTRFHQVIGLINNLRQTVRHLHTDVVHLQHAVQPSTAELAPVTESMEED